MTRFSTRDGEYFVTVTEMDGKTTQYKVHSAAGITPLQQYLLETEPGRQQSLDVVWDVDQERWYNLYPDQVLPADDGLHWTGPYKTWNGRCAECHATGYQRNYGARTGKYTSTTAEMGVGCEACHGQASVYLGWAEGQDVLADGPPNIDAYGFPIGVKAIGDQQCATCHSRCESLLGGSPDPGTPFADAYTLATLHPGLYEADGQIKDEVYVYGSFLQSKMFARGADLQTRLTRLMPLLSDKMRSVRIATAKQLLDTPPDQLARSQGVMLVRLTGALDGQEAAGGAAPGGGQGAGGSRPDAADGTDWPLRIA